MREAFDQFDTDGNGLICAAELKKVCDKMTEGEEEEVSLACERTARGGSNGRIAAVCGCA